MGTILKKTNTEETKGSSASAIEGDGPLTPTDKMEDDVIDEDDDESNSILQPGSLSDENSASPLSSVPDDFQSSRSTSPEINTKRRKQKRTVELNKKRRVRSSIEITRTKKEEEPIEEVTKEIVLEKEKSLELPHIVDIIKIEEAHDYDDQDFQQRHKDALEALAQIEVEFARLRDKMYQEKMSELNEEAVMITNGTHPELMTLMAGIEEKKGSRIHSAEAWRKHQHANFKRQFEGFEYQANIHFISQKNALRRDLLNEINNKKWSLEDERSKLNNHFREKERINTPDEKELSVFRKEQKQETDKLQDIKETIGFPMATYPMSLTTKDVDNDLKLLGLK